MNNKAFSKIWIIVVLAVLIVGGVFVWQYWWIPKEEAKKFNIDSLKSAEYQFLQLGKFQFKNGEYEDLASRIYARIYNNKIVFGDIDNDGDKDAAVITTINTGGSGNVRELAIMKNHNGKSLYLTSINLGDRVGINSITIESGIITLDMVIHTPNDPSCCPTQKEVIKYKLINNQLEKIR